jgi:hypothetical protein
MKLSNLKLGKVWLSLQGLFLICLLSACVGSPGAPAGRQVAENYFKAMEQQDEKTALSYFGKNHAPEDWQSHLDNITKTLGHVKSAHFIDEELSTVYSGRFYIMDYEVKYDTGKQARETITVFDSVKEDDKPLIASHKITAKGFHRLF